jgi:hypothetical protein
MSLPRNTGEQRRTRVDSRSAIAFAALAVAVLALLWGPDWCHRQNQVPSFVAGALHVVCRSTQEPDATPQFAATAWGTTSASTPEGDSAIVRGTDHDLAPGVAPVPAESLATGIHPGPATDGNPTPRSTLGSFAQTSGLPISDDTATSLARLETGLATAMAGPTSTTSPLPAGTWLLDDVIGRQFVGKAVVADRPGNVATGEPLLLLVPAKTSFSVIVRQTDAPQCLPGLEAGYSRGFGAEVVLEYPSPPAHVAWITSQTALCVHSVRVQAGDTVRAEVRIRSPKGTQVSYVLEVVR